MCSNDTRLSLYFLIPKTHFKLNFPTILSRNQLNINKQYMFGVNIGHKLILIDIKDIIVLIQI